MNAPRGRSVDLTLGGGADTTDTRRAFDVLLSGQAIFFEHCGNCIACFILVGDDFIRVEVKRRHIERQFGVEVLDERSIHDAIVQRIEICHGGLLPPFVGGILWPATFADHVVHLEANWVAVAFRVVSGAQSH